jgi:hypothetical protein
MPGGRNLLSVPARVLSIQARKSSPQEIVNALKPHSQQPGINGLKPVKKKTICGRASIREKSE